MTQYASSEFLKVVLKNFVLTEVSHRAVDALFDTADKILGDAALNKDLLALTQPSVIDSRVGLQPLNHALYRLRFMMNKFPETRKSFMAVILPAGPLLKMTRPIAPIRLYNQWCKS